MMSSTFLLLIVGVVLLIAVLAAVIVIGLAIYLSRKNKRGVSQTRAEEISADEAVEITSTWNMLNH